MNRIPRLPLDDQLPRSGPFASLGCRDILYRNSLASAGDLFDWRLEGQATMTFPKNRLRLENVLPADEGQRANFVLWCPVAFPDGICVEFDFHPIREPGLAMLWFAARGRDGHDLFDPALPRRTGEYDQYRHGAIDAYHAAYFRRGRPGAFQICNLRKSRGSKPPPPPGRPVQPRGIKFPITDCRPRRSACCRWSDRSWLSPCRRVSVPAAHAAGQLNAMPSRDGRAATVACIDARRGRILPRCQLPQRRYNRTQLTGRGSAWLERLVWDQKAASSNLAAPILVE